MELKPMLEVDGLLFHFDTHPVFAGYCLRLEAGIAWLRGANGAGKTTLLKLLAGALDEQAGTIRLEQFDKRRDPLAYRLHSFYCGGTTPDLPWLTAREFLDLHLTLYPATDPKRLHQHLAAFGLLGALDQSVATLSLGQHKKLQLALALSLPVRLLLIDEPFNGLDLAAATYLRAQLTLRVAMADSCIVLTSHIEPQVPVRCTIDLIAPT